MNHRYRFPGHWLPLVLLLAAGCGGKKAADKDVSYDQQAEVMAGEVTAEVHAVTSATPRGESFHLTEGHSGWGMAGCADCHALYHGGLVPADCTVCHGANGAPLREPGHSDAECAGCHGGAHEGRSFQSPGDCRSCHKYTAEEACPALEEVDVVVIGAGGGGLSAASRLAQAGLKVVVLERHNKVGGCMTNFHRGEYRFEASLHAMGGFDDPEEGNVVLFKQLGIWDKVELVKTGQMYQSVYPDFVFETHGEVDQYLADLVEMFPDEADGVTLLFEHLAEAEIILNAAVAQMKGDNEPLEKIMAENPEGATRFLGYLEKTLSEVLVDYVSDPRLIAIFTQLSSYAGAEPDIVSSLFFIMMWNSYHRHGFYYLVGGSQSVSDALAEVIVANGGTVRLNTEATDIIIEDGVATQVHTKDDVCYKTRYVVSNANVPATVELIGRDNLPNDYVASIDAMTMGLPAFVVYLGVDHDYAEEFPDFHEIILQDSHDPHDVFQAGLNCKPGDDLLLLIANYSRVDPTAAPEGKNVITLTGLVGFDCFVDAWKDHEAYKEMKGQFAELFIQRAEEVLPGLSEHIEIMEVASPQTTWAYTGNPNGSFVGFDTPPEQAILNRLPQDTPIDNLFLAGAWTFPGGGQATVLLSGNFAADKVLDKEED